MNPKWRPSSSVANKERKIKQKQVICPCVVLCTYDRTGWPCDHRNIHEETNDCRTRCMHHPRGMKDRCISIGKR
jgi:hypothetical protein